MKNKTLMFLLLFYVTQKLNFDPFNNFVKLLETLGGGGGGKVGGGVSGGGGGCLTGKGGGGVGAQLVGGGGLVGRAKGQMLGGLKGIKGAKFRGLGESLTEYFCNLC